MRKYFKDHLHLDAGSGDLTEDSVATLIEHQDDVVQKNIDEELRFINDIAKKGMDYLDKSGRDFEIPPNDLWTRERISMHLFLESPLAFRTAYDWYLYRTAANSLSHHQFPESDTSFGADDIEAFRCGVQQWYGDHTQGKLCETRHYKDEGAHVLVVTHGDYLQARTVWENGAVKTAIDRPAKEAVLRFSRDNRVLSVKLASRNKAQRDHYIRAFGRSFLGLEEVTEDVLRSTTVSLEPIRTGQFDFCEWGKGDIEWIQLTEIDLELPEISAKITLQSQDIVKTIRDDLKALDMRKGKVLAARLKFKLTHDGAPSRPIPVEIRPPHRTVFNRNRDADIIEAHLRANGVFLA